MLLVVVVTVASVQDRDGARLLVRQLPGYGKKLRKMWADSSYSGQLVDWVMVLPVVTCCNFSWLYMDFEGFLSKTTKSDDNKRLPRLLRL